MIGWILQTALVSLLLIFLVHHLLQYFQQAFTVPKVRHSNLAGSPVYKQILETLSAKEEATTSSIDQVPPPSPPSLTEDPMKEELKNFMKNFKTN